MFNFKLFTHQNNLYILYSVLYAVYIVQCTICSVHYTLYTVQCGIRTKHCTTYNIQFIMCIGKAFRIYEYTGGYGIVQCKMYIILSTLYNMQCTLWTAGCTMYNVHCTINAHFILWNIQSSFYSSHSHYIML